MQTLIHNNPFSCNDYNYDYYENMKSVMEDNIVMTDIPDIKIWGIYNNVSMSLITYFCTLMAMCFINCIGYSIVDIILSTNIPAYNDLDLAKKRYTQKNLTKSLILLIILLMSIPGLMVLLLTGKWQTEAIHFLGTVYVSTDLTGLMMVPNLSRATVVHHFCVLLFGTISVLSDYNVMGIHRAMVTLTLLSAIPYLVNGYLGLRYLENKRIREIIIDICLYTYVNSVIVNFVVQHLYVFVWLPAGYWTVKLPYMCLYYLIVYDDVNLIRYLWFKHREFNLRGSGDYSGRYSSSDRWRTRAKASMEELVRLGRYYFPQLSNTPSVRPEQSELSD